MNRDQVAISFENDRLSAVAASVSSSRVVVKGWHSADRPTEVDASSVESLGAWINAELKKAGMLWSARRGRVVFGTPRGEVVLKRIAFPPGMAEHELSGSVRLQMMRQLTVAPESASIDFTPIPTVARAGAVSPALPAGQAPGGAPGVTAALAAALSGDRLEWRRQICRAAGIRLSRVGLLSAGASALLAEASQRRGAGTLGITLGRGSTEFIVVEDGQMVFARATDLVRPQEREGISGRAGLEEFAQRVAVEAKRTWASYRATPDAAQVDHAMVLGADDAARQVAARCAESLESSCIAAELPAFVQVPAEMPPAERSACAPLIGLLAEPVIGRPTLDFAHPRKAPDLGAARRQRVLLGSLAAIILLGGGLTVVRKDLADRRARISDLKRQWDEQTADYQVFIREQARVAHLEQLIDSRADWLSHMRLLASRLPAPSDAVLTSLSGGAQGQVVYTIPRDGGRRTYEPRYWSGDTSISISLAGDVRRRAVADAFRAQLVADERYTVRTPGADVPNRFEWLLASDVLSVSEEQPTKPKNGVKNGGKR